MTSEAQLDEARLSVERNVMGRIYSSAVYPNGDGDVMRDEVLSDHIKRVSKNLTPDCAELSIPKVNLSGRSCLLVKMFHSRFSTDMS